MCKNCYNAGIDYARSHDQNDPIIINGRTLCVEDEDMTCRKIWQMTSKPIAAASLEQAEKLGASRTGLLNDRTSQANVKASTEGQNVTSETSSGAKLGEEIDVVTTEGFRSKIFTEVSCLRMCALIL